MNIGTEQGALGNMPGRIVKPQDHFGGFSPSNQPGKVGQPNGDFGTSLADQVSKSSKAGASKSLLDGFIDSVDAKQKAAAESRSSFLAGESNNLHQTMIASQEAGVAFSLMVEMRNKVMEAYQELMRMQV
jgi:flagellar hook-basal body complex protein FliE